MTDKINHHDINEETQFKVNKKKHEAKKRKFKPKTKIQRLKGVWYILTAVWVICQFISATLAYTGFYYLAMLKIAGDGFLIGCFVFCCSVFLEVAFNWLNKLIGEQKNDDDTPVSPILYGLVAAFGVVYAVSSFYGTPYGVQLLAAQPNYHDIGQIRTEHDILIKSDTSFWNGQIAKKEETKATFEGLMSKYDSKINAVRLRSDAVKPVKVMNDSITSLNTTKLASLALLKLGQSNAVDKAEEANNVMKADHLAWCDSFGFGMSFVSLACIAIFLLSFHWCQKYERDELGDNESIMSEMKKAKEKTKAQERFEIEKLKALSTKTIDKDKDKETPKVVEDEPSAPIGFAVASHKEGDIIIGEGRKSDRIYVEVKGELRPMTKGEVNTLKKGQSTTERITHLDKLMNKLK